MTAVKNYSIIVADFFWHIHTVRFGLMVAIGLSIKPHHRTPFYIFCTANFNLTFLFVFAVNENADYTQAYGMAHLQRLFYQWKNASDIGGAWC